MVRLMALLLATAIWSLMASDAQAAKYTCKSAHKLSRLGTHDSDTVVVDPDDANKVCRFSVNGEPAGSPPREQLVKARNTLRAGIGSSELGRGNFEWLAYLLLAASQEEGVSGEFRSQLEQEAKPLTKCMEALERSETDYSFDNGENLFCRFVEGGSESFGFPGAQMVEVQTKQAYYVVGARRGKNASFLFIPLQLFRGDPIP